MTVGTDLVTCTECQASVELDKREHAELDVHCPTCGRRLLWSRPGGGCEMAPYVSLTTRRPGDVHMVRNEDPGETP